ncbi:MAG: hypothetical protein LBF69_05410 [Prevotellaceae bacterium]|jgi:hypothetical protein|nr:hypothetical protein [Prevotellaceae bacterium]
MNREIQQKSERSKSAVIIELGGSHAECIHAQIHYLTIAGYQVHLICDEVVWSQIEEKQRLAGVQIHQSRRNILQRILTAVKIHRYLRKYEICVMVVNTIEVSAINDMCCLPLPRKLKCVGLLHNARKLLTGRSLRFIVGKKVKKFFVLGEYIRKNFQPQTKYNLAVFYPIYFPTFAPVPVRKSTCEIWITIPGVVDPSRRDYTSLLQGIKEKGLCPTIKIIFLGKWDTNKNPDIARLLEEAGVWKNQIVVFKEFVNNPVFHSYVYQSDLIVPLLHPFADNPLSIFYGDHRISGSFNLSFAYKIPMLIEQSMMQYDDFRDCSFFYKAEDLVDVINSFVHRKQELQRIRDAMRHNERWNEENILRQYLRFIEL